MVFLQQGGAVVSFAVVLVAETPEGLVNIARYDTAHGVPHRDLLGRRKGLLRKQWFPKVSSEKVMNHAVADFKKNHENYLRLYEQN